MSTMTTADGVSIFYKDWGPKDAQPIMFHHGWPLTADDWDNQMLFFLTKGYCVVAHDRRGHGALTRPNTNLTVNAAAHNRPFIDRGEIAARSNGRNALR